MTPNPFIISEKVITKYFCDRKEESAELIRLLTSGNNVVLISHRRIGKTSLIQYCYQVREIQKNYFTFYVDILSTNNLQEFIYLLGKEIVAAIRPLGKKMLTRFIETVKSISGNVGFDLVTGMPTFNFRLGDIKQPEYTLKEIFEYLNNADRPCILAIDEFQQVSKYPEKGIEALIRSHIQQINNARFIFSGSERHLLEQMFLSPSRPFYHSCTFLELKPISRNVYSEFICRMFRQGKRKISKELAEKVYDMFEGYTFYVQRICNGIYEMTPEGEEATPEMMEISLSNALYSYDTLFRERLFRLSTRQKELLFAIAAEGTVEKATSVQFIQKYALASASAVQTAMKALSKMEIIDQEEGKIFIAEKFFAIWIKRNYVI